MADIVTFRNGIPDAVREVHKAAVERCGRDIATRTDKHFIKDILACVSHEGYERTCGQIFVDGGFVMNNPDKLVLTGDKPEETVYVGARGKDNWGYVTIHHVDSRTPRMIMKYEDTETADEYLKPISGYRPVDEDAGLYEQV